MSTSLSAPSHLSTDTFASQDHQSRSLHQSSFLQGLTFAFSAPTTSTNSCSTGSSNYTDTHIGSSSRTFFFTSQHRFLQHVARFLVFVALHLDFPASTGSGVMHSRSVTGVHVHPVALFSILDHYLRRNDGQHRVIGTLLGTRTESEIEIKNCFAVPHLEDEEEGQVQVDMEYHRNMYELCQKVRPDEVIVGWYATSPELNTYSALIQDFYSRETAPHQAVHLTMDTSIDGSKASGLGIKSYISSPLGATPKAENCVLLPLPTNLLHSTPEHSSLSLLASQNISSPLSDLDALAVSLKQVQAQLDRVLTYVRAVISGEKEGDKAVGRFLNDTISVVPAGMDDNKLETLFNAHLQDVLMVSYLANVVRAQAEVSSRLTLLT